MQRTIHFKQHSFKVLVRCVEIYRTSGIWKCFVLRTRIGVVTWHREPRFQCGSAQTGSIWNSATACGSPWRTLLINVHAMRYVNKHPLLWPSLICRLLLLVIQAEFFLSSIIVEHNMVGNVLSRVYILVEHDQILFELICRVFNHTFWAWICLGLYF